MPKSLMLTLSEEKRSIPGTDKFPSRSDKEIKSAKPHLFIFTCCQNKQNQCPITTRSDAFFVQYAEITEKRQASLIF